MIKKDPFPEENKNIIKVITYEIETIDHLNLKSITDYCKNELFPFGLKDEVEANDHKLFNEKELRAVIGKNSKNAVRNRLLNTQMAT